jgi:hypothetical protein
MKQHILKSILIIIVGVLLFSNCEEPTEPDTTPPSITITSSFNDTVFEIVTITVMVTDDSGIEKVELWVDGGFTGISDDTEPYTLDWNTTTYEDGSSHIIVVRAYDKSENTSDSSPLTLTVDNSVAIPTAVDLSVTYSGDSFILTWSRNNDTDFSSYLVYESDTDNQASGVLIYETESQDDTTYTVIDITEDDEVRYYWVSVQDTVGLNNLSNTAIGYSIISLPSEFPLEGGTAWVYEVYSYENESDYVQEINAEISYDTLFIENFENDEYLYYWNWEWLGFPIVKNFDNKLITIGLKDYNDTVFYDIPIVEFVYDESFDTTLIKQDYLLSNLIDRYTVIDTFNNVPYYTYQHVYKFIIPGLWNGIINEYVIQDGLLKVELEWIGEGSFSDVFDRIILMEKLDNISLNKRMTKSQIKEKIYDTKNYSKYYGYIPLPLNQKK